MIGLIIPAIGTDRRKFQGADEAVARLEPVALHVESHAAAYPELCDDRAEVHGATRVANRLGAERRGLRGIYKGPERIRVGRVRLDGGVRGIESHGPRETDANPGD